MKSFLIICELALMSTLYFLAASWLEHLGWNFIVAVVFVSFVDLLAYVCRKERMTHDLLHTPATY